MKKNKPKSLATSAREPGDDAFFEDHRALQDLLGRVENAKDLSVLIPMLEQLQRLLQGHFNREEAPEGPYDTIGEIAPRHLGRLQELINEHKEFLAGVKDVRQKAEECLNGPVARIHKDVKLLCDRLQKHETDETALFMDALNTDLGQSE